MVRIVALCFLLLRAGCSNLKIGREPPPPTTFGWAGRPLGDFVASNPHAKPVYQDSTLHLFQTATGYGHCDIAVTTNGQVISDVVTMCPLGTLELLARSTRRGSIQLPPGTDQ